MTAEVVWCPCGHAVGGDYACLNGLIYGPCGHENCYGACVDVGDCKALAGCCDDDDDGPTLGW